MAWNTLSIQDLQRKLAAAEYTSVTTVSLPDGMTGTQVVEEEISNGIQEVRGYVAGYASNVLGEGQTVPDELRDVTLVLIRYRTFTRLPGMKRLLDELRVREYDEALRKLRDVAAGRFRVVSPETAAPEQAGGSTIAVVSKTRRRAKRENLDGLF